MAGGRKTYVGTATQTTLAGGINSTDVTVTLADASTYGAPSVGAPMVIVVGAETVAEEQILISGRSGNVLTVAASGRNWQAGGGTTGVAHALGEVVRHVLDADSIDDANRHVNVDTDDDHSQYLNAARFVTAHDVTARHPTAVIADLAITTAKIVDANVTTAKIADGAVTIAKLSTRPMCSANRTTSQTITNNTLTVVAFNAESFDTDTMHDTVTNQGRLTFTTAGVYVVTFNSSFPTNGSGTREFYIRLNGATIIANASFSPAQVTGSCGCPVSVTYKFAAADYVEALVLQTTGGDFALQGGAQFSAAWLGVG